MGKKGIASPAIGPCGERVVRVDVVERLAGMIRAAIAGEAPGGADGPSSQRTSKGFVVSGAMTSLTGCSGEQFASILRSMGFRSVEMKRSEFFTSQSAKETAGHSEPPKPAEDQGSTGDEHAPPPAADEDEVSAETALAAPLAEPSSEGVLADADAVPEDLGAVAKGDDALAADVEAAPEPVAAPEDVEIALQGVAGADGADDLSQAADALARAAASPSLSI